MIPPDVANSLRQLTPDIHSATHPQTQSVVPAQKLADVLSNLVPGQRVMAEIQALLPNGTYRAIVAQRDITLALPFSAKPGDSLELEVVDSDGKVTLAVVAKQAPEQQGRSQDNSASTTLSSAGKMIGNLLGDIDNQGKRAAPAPLNGNQPLTESFSGKAADLAPILKDALVKSGVFYEAHQARWMAGQLPTAQLLLEPQGKHSLPTAGASQNTATQPPPGEKPLAPGNMASQGVPTMSTPQNAPALPGNLPPIGTPAQADAANTQQAQAPANTTQNSIPADLKPIVQQQLDALATQTFAWQGQVWTGQQMFWEIDERQDNHEGSNNEISGQWQTRLKLDLPRTGGIEATLFLLPGNEIKISIATNNGNSQSLLTTAGEQLRQQFEAAGLNLSGLTVKHDPATD